MAMRGTHIIKGNAWRKGGKGRARLVTTIAG